MARNVAFVSALLVLTSVSYADWVAIGPDGGNIVALALDPQQPATLYALPYEYPDDPRVFKTTTGGSVWTSVGLLPDYSVSMLLVDPHDSDYLYGMTSNAAVWRSTDGGVSWDNYALPTNGTSLAADPLVPGRLLASGYNYTTYAVPAVMTSTDYGQSWSITELDPDTGYAYCIDFDPVHSGTAYAGCAYGLMFKTTDGGAHWDSACAGLPATASMDDIAVNPGNPDIVLAAASDGVYRTTDAGGSWSKADGITIAFDLALSPANPALAYCLGYASEPCLYASTDSGATWALQPGAVQQSKGGSLIIDPSDADVVYSPGAMGVIKTADRGEHWAAANTGIRIASIPTISSSPWNPQAVYVEATGNAVFQSQCAGDTWTRCADFLSCGAICGIGLAPGVGADVMWALEGAG
jgi:photosystem II stability/assembly factor-like uncharacterized protein